MMMQVFEKVVIVTKPTPVEEMCVRYNNAMQARFVLNQQGLDFDEFQQIHELYHRALDRVREAIPRTTRVQVIERSQVPNFVFGPGDLVVPVGPDGLVVNVSKYLDGQPILAFNPDPSRIDGVLVPYTSDKAGVLMRSVLRYDFRVREITMAKASLNDGQVLHAVNDLFIGQRTHVSARYRLRFGERSENQSSSGIIVSTGAGSTGWLRSIHAMAAGVAAERMSRKLNKLKDGYQFDETSRTLRFVVREPFESRATQADLVCGEFGEGEELEIESRMTSNGTIFGDGVENDFLEFNSGTVARISVSERRVRLIA